MKETDQILYIHSIKMNHREYNGLLTHLIEFIVDLSGREHVMYESSFLRWLHINSIIDVIFVVLPTAVVTLSFAIDISVSMYKFYTRPVSSAMCIVISVFISS